ncbi:MAG: phage tail protein [Clostridia bacterium]|nr:phage tail protein [Clostridia bacterium]
MIPILMQNDTVVGFLADALSCVVTEERNGVFELTLTYPVTGALFDKLQIDRFVKAKSNDTADLQLFRIYEVTKPMNGVVTVNAEHVSYALSNFPVDEINITGTATQAINAVLSDVTYDLDYFDKVNPFMVATADMDAVKAFSFKIGSARAALGGTEGSILDVYGGEYEFDNYTIRLHKNRGRDTGIVIAYGKNMTDIKVTTSLESAYTALYPYAIKDDVLYVANVWEYDTEPTLTFIEYDPIMPVTNNAGIADRMLIRDFTNEFVKDETVSNRTLAEKAEKWLQKHDINSPSVNVTVSFVQLWESSEYEELKALEQVSLCDWVTVRHKDLGIDMKAQVVKTVYDTIAEWYNKIELGSAKANFGDTIRQAANDLTKLVQSIDTAAISSQITREYQAAIQRATKAITGAEYGAVRLPQRHGFGMHGLCGSQRRGYFFQRRAGQIDGGYQAEHSGIRLGSGCNPQQQNLHIQPDIRTGRSGADAYDAAKWHRQPGARPGRRRRRCAERRRNAERRVGTRSVGSRQHRICHRQRNA